MAAGSGSAGQASALAPTCRLVVRKDDSFGEVLEFVVAGLEIGQQIVALAGPSYLKELARSLTEHGLRPGTLLRSGRVLFLTAPDCIPSLLKTSEPYERSPLRLSGSVVRWVSDWSWACGCKGELEFKNLLDHQRRVHEFVGSLTSLGLCTVNCEKLGRSSLLAMMAAHRRGSRAVASTPVILSRGAARAASA